MISEHQNHRRLIHLRKIFHQLFKGGVRNFNQRQIPLQQFVIRSAVNFHIRHKVFIFPAVAAVVLHRYVKDKHRLSFRFGIVNIHNLLIGRKVCRIFPQYRRIRKAFLKITVIHAEIIIDIPPIPAIGPVRMDK